jgi:hypothetical protein
MGMGMGVGFATRVAATQNPHPGMRNAKTLGFLPVGAAEFSFLGLLIYAKQLCRELRASI